jgi:hypothetical protein
VTLGENPTNEERCRFCGAFLNRMSEREEGKCIDCWDLDEEQEPPDSLHGELGYVNGERVR